MKPHLSTHYPDDELHHIAQRLWPHNQHYQTQWMRCVRLLRTTARGWVIDPREREPGDRKHDHDL